MLLQTEEPSEIGELLLGIMLLIIFFIWLIFSFLKPRFKRKTLLRISISTFSIGSILIVIGLITRIPLIFLIGFLFAMIALFSFPFGVIKKIGDYLEKRKAEKLRYWQNVHTDNYEYCMTLAQESIAKKQWQEVEMHCIEALREMPDAIDPWLVMAQSFTELERWAQAETCYRKVLRVKPNHAEAKLGVKTARSHLGEQNSPDETPDTGLDPEDLPSELSSPTP